MNTYANKEEFFNILNASRDMNNRIAKMGREINKMREPTEKLSHFERWEFAYQPETPKAPNLDDDYYLDRDGEYYHYDTGTKYSEDFAEFERQASEYEQDRKIEAIYYLGWESEYTTITFPARYLWTENWREEEQAVIDAQKAKEAAEEEARAAKRKADKEAEDRATYERLKNKFETEN